MARPVSRGLTYMSLDVNFFRDRMIRRLKHRAGKEAPFIFIAIMCTIFAEGYYIEWDDDVVFDLSDMTGYDEASITAVVEACLELGLLSKEMKDEHCVLTSHGIQKQYQLICKQSKRVNHVDEYSLLVSSEEMGVSSEEMGVSSEEIPKNSEEMQQRIIKESKENKKDSSSPLSPSSFRDGEEESEEKEKILLNFFFRNWLAPEKEMEKFLKFNNSDGRRWATMSAAQKDKLLELWRQTPEQRARFPGDSGSSFLRLWNKMYEGLKSLEAPKNILMDALSDNFSWEAQGGTLYITASKELTTYIERPEHLEQLGPILKRFMKDVHCTKITYSTYHKQQAK